MEKEKYSYGYAQEKYKPLKQKEEKYNLKLKKGNYYIKCALIIKPNNGFLKTKGGCRMAAAAILFLLCYSSIPPPNIASIFFVACLK